MTVDDKTLQNFFDKQKKPKIDALVSIIRPQAKERLETKLIKNNIQNNERVDGKTNIEPAPNWHQTGIKLVPNQHQTSNRSDTQTGTKLVPNQHQTDIKIGFFSLTGLQKKIALLIYDLCKFSRDKKTDAISISQLSNQCKSTVGAVKIAIYRLIGKNILIRESFKNGRGGWSVYSLPNDTYQEILNLESQTKLVPNWYQTGTKVDTELVSKVIPTASSSSNYINNITTTREITKRNMEPEWIEMDIEPLAEIGFTKTHIEQIASQNLLTPDLVQDSIYAYAFDLQENNKTKSLKGDPLSYFMGIIRKGNPYAPPGNYESAKDKVMRLYLERRREIDQKRTEMEKEVFDFAFKEWFYELKDDEIVKIVPTGIKYNKGSKMCEEAAKDYFSKEIWENKRVEILLGR